MSHPAKRQATGEAAPALRAQSEGAGQPSPLATLYPRQLIYSLAEFASLVSIPGIAKIGLLSHARYASYDAVVGSYPAFPPDGFTATRKAGRWDDWATAEGKKLSQEGRIKLAVADWGRANGFRILVRGKQGVFGLPEYSSRDEGFYFGDGLFMDAEVLGRSGRSEQAIKSLLGGGRVDVGLALSAMCMRWREVLMKLPEDSKPELTKLADGVRAADPTALLTLSNTSGSALVRSAAAAAASCFLSSLSFGEAIDLTATLNSLPAITQLLSQIPSFALPFVPAGKLKRYADGSKNILAARKLKDLSDDEPVILADTRPSPGQIASLTDDMSLLSAEDLQEVTGSDKQPNFRPKKVVVVRAEKVKELAMRIANFKALAEAEKNKGPAPAAGNVAAQGGEEGEGEDLEDL